MCGLLILDQSDDINSSVPPETEVPKESETFRTVAAALNLGLGMIESDRSRKALRDIGEGVVSNQRSTDHIYEESQHGMMWWVDLFLARLRGSFPPVVLTNRIGGEGQTQRANWAQGGLRLRQWEPKDAGILRLNKSVSMPQVFYSSRGCSTVGSVTPGHEVPSPSCLAFFFCFLFFFHKTSL